MPWTRDFRVSTITLDINNNPAVNVRGIVSANAAAQTETEPEMSSGSIYADTIVTKTARPMITFTTVDIPGAITAFGLTGLCINGDVDDAGIAFYGQKQDCAGIATGSVHDKYTVKSAVVVPKTLSVDHRGNAQLTYDVFTRSEDGTTAPIVYAQNQALPSVPTTPLGRWTMRNMTVATVAVTGKRNISIDFGARVTAEGADSEFYDSVTSLGSLLPVVTVRGVDTGWLQTVAGLLGGSALHADTNLQLKRRDHAIGTASHVILTFNGLITWDQIFNLTIDNPGEAAFQIHLNTDGTLAPIVATTGVVLP